MIATLSRDASKESRAGSIRALWKALAVFSRLTLTPSDSKRFETVSMSVTGPLTTWWVPLSPEMLSPTPDDTAFSSRTAAATCAAGANTAAMAPSSMFDISSPRVQANCVPSSRLNTPAVCAAASSPMLCPITTLGRMPTLAHSAVNAHSSAYSAGCSHAVSVSSPCPPARPNITFSREAPRISRTTSSQRFSTARTTGSRS